MWIDVGFLIFLSYGFYLGYSKGILKTVFAIISILVAVLLSMKLSPIFIDIVERFLKLGPQISLILGFVLCFIAILFIVRLIGKSAEKLLKAVKLNFINKIVGGVLMAILFVISYSAILWFLNESNLLSEEQKEQSITYEQLEPIPAQARGTIAKLKPAFQSFWEKSTNAINDSNNNPQLPTDENIQE